MRKKFGHLEKAETIKATVKNNKGFFVFLTKCAMIKQANNIGKYHRCPSPQIRP